jgi:hypothetical protein
LAVRIQVSKVIERPVADVFRFYATEHVRNHPRWDRAIQLEQASPGPIDVGTIINRVNSRSGSPVKGTMEVVEFEPDQSIAMAIHDGPIQMKGRATFEPENGGSTLLSFDLEIPGMEEAIHAAPLRSDIMKTLGNIKRLIESEG